MSGKVKITQEQADWLERYELTQDQIDHYIDIQPFRKRPDSPIVDWSASKLAKALYTGYEVEPEFKMGQWIYDITDKNKTVIEVAYATDRRVHGFWKTQYSDIDTHVAIENARHFTKEEIAKEKERRLDVKLNGLLSGLNKDKKYKLLEKLKKEAFN